MAKNDRIGKYLKKYTDGLLFAPLEIGEVNMLSPLSDLAGADIPFREEDVREFRETGALSHAKLSENMGLLLGIDPGFIFNKAYIAYLKRFWGDKIVEGYIHLGKSFAQGGQFELACVYFRAALLLAPENVEANYQYAHACRAAYLARQEEALAGGGDDNDEDYIGLFKAEALDFFEECTILEPEFADAYYYLGYAYVNMGLYLKAKLAWERFVEYSTGEDSETAEMISEIRARIAEVSEPVNIEEAVNDIARGAYSQGLEVLENYANGTYSKWWPMHFYMGIAYEALGRAEEAIEAFRRTLSINASHRESIEELARLYEALGDGANAEKYRGKLGLV